MLSKVNFERMMESKGFFSMSGVSIFRNDDFNDWGKWIDDWHVVLKNTVKPVPDQA